jgi:hypothetical protein
VEQIHYGRRYQGVRDHVGFLAFFISSVAGSYTSTSG